MSVLLGTTSIKKTDFYNVIVCRYAYDYANEEFTKSYTYPESDALNYSYQVYGKKRSIEIKMPIHYTEANVQMWAKLYYGLWAFGVTTSESTSNLENLESIWYYPEMGSSIVYGLTFAINRKQLMVTGDKVRLHLTGWNSEGDHMNAWGQ